MKINAVGHYLMQNGDQAEVKWRDDDVAFGLHPGRLQKNVATELYWEVWDSKTGKALVGTDRYNITVWAGTVTLETEDFSTISKG